jgi:hypothetical protein
MVVGFLKGLAHAVAWAVAAGAAVTLSWWGVHTVMEGTVYDPPRAVPLTGSSAASQPVSSSTRRPRPTPTATTGPPARPAPSPSFRPSTAGPSHPPSPHPSPDGTDDEVEDGVVRPYDTKGGRVVLDIGKTRASLVSATPRSGWSMQVWKTSTWLRVEFASDTEKVSLICDWYQQQPQVQIVDG